MVISRTPFRVSFFGGGTDYPAWYLKEGGAVLSTTIDKYCYITSRYLPPFFRELKHRIIWRHVENVYSLNDILHPAIRKGLPYMGYDDSQGLEIHYQGDLPARSGMGSSSAFAVGFIKAMAALRGDNLDKHELALKAIELEQRVLNENVGSQDQVAVAYGGLNVIRFRRDGEITVEALSISEQRLQALQSRLLLFYTGAARTASEVAADVIANMSTKRHVLTRLHEYVEIARSLLASDDSLDRFGNLLDETWNLKKQQSDLISNSFIDEIYDTACKNGAIGGKLLGAGSSGFMLFYVPLDHQQDVIHALGQYLNVPFRFDSTGCTLVHFEKNGNYL